MIRQWATNLLRAAAFFAVYLATSKLLHAETVVRQALLWLPTGVAVSGLWLLGPGYWPVVALGTIVDRILPGVGYTFPYAMFAAIGNSLEALAAVAILRRMGFRPDFRRLKDGLALLVAALLAPIISATVGRATHLIHSGPDPLTFLEAWMGWWRMNSLGILVVVPLVLSWSTQPRSRPSLRALIEITGLTASVLALVWFLTSINAARDDSGMVLSYMALPVALYAAVRFSVRGAATAAAGIVLLLTMGTAHGIGPFVSPLTVATPYPVHELALQALIMIVTVTPMLLGVVIAEREGALAEIAVERGRREELLASINRNVSDGLFRCARDGSLLYANRAMARMLGYPSPDDLLNVPFATLLQHAECARDLEALIEAQGQVVNQEMVLVRTDGTRLTVLLSGTAVLGPDGALQYCDGAISDITARKRLEEQLRQAQKMEALGRLAGGVSHDFNNLLTAIGGFAELLVQKLPRGGPERAHADEIVRATDQAASLTSQLLAYSRRQVLAPRPLDLRQEVVRLGGMLRRLIGEDIQLVVENGEVETWAQVDGGQIEQVILNLVLNARDAMPDGGTLRIATAPIDLDAAFANTHAELSPGPHVLLEVRDTGVGMNAEIQSRVFDPFFTTKEQGKGTGLGLSTVHGIVHQSGGLVTIESASGMGTTVRIYIPRIDPPPAGPAPEPRAMVAQHQGGTVLVVEDEPIVRKLVCQTLRDAGCTVLAAINGEEALEIAHQAHAPIDLLVTDVIMPGMGGRELTTRLQAERPGLRALLMSGYIKEAMEANGSLPPGVEFLQKPFTPSVLQEWVRRMLAAVGTGAR